MKNDADWFRNGALKCAEDHKRVFKTWRQVIIAGWILLSFCFIFSAASFFFRLWGLGAMMGLTGIIMIFTLRDSYQTRKELCDQWLRQRDLYQQEYEKRK